MTPGDRIARSNRAIQLLHDPLLQQVFSGVRMALVERLESSGIGDEKTQHEIALMLQLLKQLNTHLLNFADDGKLAAKEVEHENWLAKFRKKSA